MQRRIRFDHPLLPHMERQVGHGAAARRLCQKIDKQLACRLQSITTLLSVGVQPGPCRAAVPR